MLAWSRDGRIRSITTPGGVHLYALDDVHKLFHHTAGNDAAPQLQHRRRRISYARVSSDHQKPDLQRQIAFLKQQCPDHELVADIGSGLNWNRPGFTAILDAVLQRRVEEIVVAHKDRLCRFGVELVERICAQCQCTLVVLDHGSQNEDEPNSLPSELADDLLSIVTVFVARHNGQRSATNRKRRREKQQQQQAKRQRNNDREEEEKEKSQAQAT
jgi:predicted site-specific integrase-resolvase